MPRTYKATKVLDANIWLTTDAGPRFRIYQLFREPGRFVVEQFFDDGADAFPVDEASTLKAAQSMVERHSAPAPA